MEDIVFDIYEDLEIPLKAKAIIENGLLIKIVLLFNAGKKDLYHFKNDAGLKFSELYPDIKDSNK